MLALTLQSHGAFGAIRTRGLLLTEETLYPLELRRRELGEARFERASQILKDLRDCLLSHSHQEPRAGLEPAASEAQAPRSRHMS